MGLEGDAVLGPETREDLEVPLEEPAAPLERHADGVELARVPAGGHAEDQAALRDDVERAERLGRHGRVPQREHQDAGPELDTAGPRRDRRQRADGVENGKAGSTPRMTWSHAQS